MLTKNITTKPEMKTDDGNTIVLPFKDQIAANAARRQLRDLSSKINCRHLTAYYCVQKIGAKS